MKAFHLSVSRNFLQGCFVGSILLWGACSSQGKKELSPIQLAFKDQLVQTCMSEGGIYTKTVTQYTKEEEDQTETLEDTLSSSENCSFQEELAFLIQKVYDDPVLVSKFDIQAVEDTTVANLLPSERSSSELRLQKSMLSSEGQLRYIETHIERNTWLYKTRIRGWARFDSLGRYQAHEIESYMEVATVKSPFHALVSGKLVAYE